MQRKYLPSTKRKQQEQRSRQGVPGVARAGRFGGITSPAAATPRQQQQQQQQQRARQRALQSQQERQRSAGAAAGLHVYRSQQQQQQQHQQLVAGRQHQHRAGGGSFSRSTGASGDTWQPRTSTAAQQNAAAMRQQHALRFVPTPAGHPGIAPTAASPWNPPFSAGTGSGRSNPGPGAQVHGRPNVPLKLPSKAKGKPSVPVKKPSSKVASVKAVKAGSTTAKYTTTAKASSASASAAVPPSKKGKKRGPKPGWKKRKALAAASKVEDKKLPALPISRVHKSFLVPVESVQSQVWKAMQFIGHELRTNDIWPLKQSGLQLAAVLEQCVREVLLPQLLLGEAHEDRCFWAALLGARELMTQNANKFFELSSLDLSSPEQQVEGQILATGIVVAALLRCPGYHDAQEKFTQLMQDYDAGKGTFATTEDSTRRRTAVMGRVDGRNQPILPNGKELDAEESVAWRVSFNLARKRHPLLHGSKGAVDGDDLIDLPAPTACHVSLVEELPVQLR